MGLGPVDHFSFLYLHNNETFVKPAIELFGCISLQIDAQVNT